MKIAVIGAGLSGLAAAYRMQQAGHEVQVIEASDRPGGYCKALHQDGFVIDTCSEIAASSYRRWLALIDEVGLGGDVVKSPTVVSLLQDGRLIDIDMGSLMSVAFTPVVSWGAKLRFLRGAFSLRGKFRSVPEFLIDDVSLEDPGNDAEAVSRRVFGHEITEKLIEPIVRPVSGVTMNMVSTIMMYYTLSDWTQLISLRGGLDRLPMALAERLDVRYQATVKRVHSNAGDVTMEYIDVCGAPGVISADKCLITTMYDQAEDIYPRFAEISNGFRQKMQFLRMLDVKLAYGKAPVGKASMVMMSYRENPKINVISLSHNKAPDRAPAGHALFSLFTEHRHYDDYAAMSDGEVVAMMRRQIEELYPEVKGHFLFSRVSRQERVCYVPDAGYFHRARQLWDAVGREPRVHLGGAVLMSGGMEAAVLSGERAAERLLNT